MPMTNFPGGFAAGLNVRGMPLLQTHPGNVFWVDNSPTPNTGPGGVGPRSVGGSDSNHGTYQRPFATIAYALSQCQQGNGDIIMVKPGHVEYVTGAGTTSAVLDPTGNITLSAQNTLTFNVGDVAIVGLGAGPSRPIIVFNTATGANIPVRAGGMSIQNFVFAANYAAVASAFTGTSASCATSTIVGTTLTVGTPTGTVYPGMVLSGTKVIPGTMILSQLTGTTGAAGTYQVDTYHTASATSTTIIAGPQDFSIESCEFRDMSASLNFVAHFTGSPTNANAADGFRFVNNRISSLGTTAGTTSVKATVAEDRWTLTDNVGVYAALNASAALLVSTAALTNLDVGRNRVHRPSTAQSVGLLMAGVTGSTGHVYDNYAWSLTATPIICTTGTGLAFSQNFSNNTGSADKSGLLLPASS